ncbi:hypothetical protein MHL31_04780 [Lutibacter sp. A80]|uniref:hypothetical protein n=1 Tax=Lutibacter sp. A80 TaxID=2918453 RepID=UPI001F05195A|nr:hypothetical protein [Lutibacter sp. A80]UMB61523.1 hypothetical protein MHL31_04780 [Lutibacter sp. A80]
MGNHLYNSNIFNWNIPDSFDPGHPPTLGFLLAIIWKVMGHKLWVSHLLMIPFTVGLFYQIHKFVSYYFKDNLIILLGFILIFADPTLFTQLVIVNPEVIQLFFFFLAVNSILYNKNTLKVSALFFLSIISYRSMMLCAGVFLFDFFNNLIIHKQKIKTFFNSKFILNYVIASLPALIYITWRLIEKGWIQTHPNSPWFDLWHFTSAKEFLRNIAVLGHRYIDFGRIFLILFIIYSFIKFKKNILTQKIKQLILLAITSVLVIVITSLITTNTFGHRYFIVSYIALNLLTFVIIKHFYINKKIIYIFLLFGLISGNFWIYPRNIAQGWDASLAHVPYHNLRIEAIKYLDNNHIKIEDIGTFFPNATSIDNIDLSGDLRSFRIFDFKNEYVLFSNVYNLSDEEYHSLDTNYNIIKQFKNKGIYINIYKLKK